MAERLALPELSLQERARRWEALRAAMAQRNLDCLVVMGDSGKWDSRIANVRYITHLGGSGEDAAAIFPLEGEPTAFLWGGGAVGWWKRVSPWISDLRLGRPFWSRAIAGRVKELGLEKGQIGLVGLAGWYDQEGSFPHDTYLGLAKELPQAAFENATDILERLRLIKSQEEINFTEKAAQIGDKAVETLIASASPGREEFKVYADVVHTIMAEGSEPPMFLWEAGPSPYHPGKFPTWRRLEKGDLIINEISPRYGGYFAHPHQPVAIGKPSRQLEKMFEVVLESFQAGLERLRPGITLAELDQAFIEPITRAGYTWSHPHFHGLGLAMPEYPVGSAPGPGRGIVPDGAMEIKPGMIFAIEPVVSTGKMSLPLGETVVVTPDGCRRLGKRKLELPVAE